MLINVRMPLATIDRKKFAECVSVWISCTSQHDTSMHEAYRPPDPEFNNNMSTLAVFLDIEKALETTWHPGLLYELNKVHFPSILFKFLSSFLSSERFRATIESEMSTPRDIQARMPQGSVLNLSLYSLYINYTPQNLRDYLSPLCR
jgi:hypothetical protein